jgi:SAM-dependent methyltransferase
MEVARRAAHRVNLVYWRVRPRRSALLEVVAPLARDARAFEVGGPSEVFGRRGLLPVYPLVGSLDNANFSDRTLWEDHIEEGATFRFDPGKPAGQALIREATDLRGVVTGAYDVLLSSHTLEHVADPIAALREWRRVLRPGGALVLILPDPRATFDHRRPVTAFEHLLEDERNATAEDDLTHLPEIVVLHDLDRDPLAGTREEFEARSRDVLRQRALHHHVFDPPLVARLLEHAGFEVLAAGSEPPFHLVTVARSTAQG